MILSIQSHVAYGYVGNRAAVFPLERQGQDVVVINTVQFSNHTGYGSWTGDIYTSGQIRALISGLWERGLLENITAILSGYLGTAETGQIVLDTVEEIRAHNPDALYVCDPVMGDTGRGIFVNQDIPSFFRDRGLPRATVITPNQFELELLTGLKIANLNDAFVACRKAIDQGCRIVLVTSLVHDATPAGSIQMLAATPTEKYLITTPRLDFPIAPNGAGDLTSSLFLGHYLRSGSVQSALELTATGIFAVFEATHAAGRRELALVAAQDAFVAEKSRFTAIAA